MSSLIIIFEAEFFLKKLFFSYSRISSFWNYKNATLNAIPNIESREFVKDMIEEYFGLSFNYLCFYHTEGARVCSGLPLSPKAIHNYESFNMNLINAISKVSSIVL
jgi:hypothetical protein